MFSISATIPRGTYAKNTQLLLEQVGNRQVPLYGIGPIDALADAPPASGQLGSAALVTGLQPGWSVAASEDPAQPSSNMPGLFGSGETAVATAVVSVLIWLYRGAWAF